MRYLFDEYAFDTDRRELRRGTNVVSIAPQVFDLLDYLIRNRERVVSKDDLINTIWNGRSVSDAALTTRLNAVRSAIGDSGEEQRLIKTLPRKGFRFVGQVREAREAAGMNSGEAAPESALAVPDKPSIVVLPFENMSGDPEQDYFADGMVEDIITALSRFKSLFVIARNSSFVYKGRTVDVRQVGRELGVRYVLEGSVRKAGHRVRITGQLVEAATDRHLWADNFDGALEDVFGLQDQVTMSVVGLIAPKLEQAEIERSRQKPTDKLDSYDLYLRGMALAPKRRTQLEAREFFKKAIERDPDYAAAYAMAAWTFLVQQVTGGLPLSADMRAEAIQLARLGARAENSDAFTLARCGHVLTYFGHEYDRGLFMVEQAVALNANLAIAWYSRGWVALMCGETERAIESFERMIRLSPFDPLRASTWLGISFAHFHQGRFEEGCVSAAKVLQFNADANMLEAYIANSVGAGHVAEAREAAARLLKLQPDYHASHGREAVPFRSIEVRERITASLRAAGLPE
ncbi:winged helix-turn-helix domain-containing protein [Bradyrhizobium manausense]|uniref:winged helix-turn-helix domain-containing tetratricopeptide repeat protein n=1 Tax=Bradyrhizobium TaxID=374 RepID=UPI001BA54F1C|nr:MULTISPECIES: winged helix-turn-helix domain-containing tetratricopeptide repeat protein [Bradyrhizobium]MBR0825208.1 winged helix-turn-helix domain-containing protein [Bradyrhizobium manausense]UVO28396.1 winged helix-turn-helix domain-containing tetratricopeptide repeat protein [Bradyrhizobium arachidis]